MEPEPWLVEILKVAVPALFASGGLAYVVRHLLEQRAAEKARKRALVEDWRKMVKQVNFLRGDKVDCGALIQKETAYMSLAPYMTEAARREVQGESNIVVVGSGLGAQLEVVVMEITRIEKEWKLRD